MIVDILKQKLPAELVYLVLQFAPKEDGYLMKTTFNYVYNNEEDESGFLLHNRYMYFCLFDNGYKSDHNSIWVDRLERIVNNRPPRFSYFEDVSNYVSVCLRHCDNPIYDRVKRLDNNTFKYNLKINCGELKSEITHYYLFDDDEVIKHKLIEIVIPYGTKVKGSLYDPEKKIYYGYYKNKELIEKYKKTYLDIPYELRHLGKENKCKWDNEQKQWFTYKSHPLVKEYEDKPYYLRNKNI